MNEEKNFESKNSLGNFDQKNDNAALIVSELIDLLNDERTYRDMGIIIEITKTVHLLIKQGGSRSNEVLAHPNLIITLTKLFNTDNDLTRLLASLFHDLSIEEDGIRLLLLTGVIPILLQTLESLNDDVINFVLTTLRNCLIGLNNESAEEIQAHNGCMTLISLLIHRHSNKQMNFLADCLLRLAMFNTNAQIYLQTSKLFLQELVTILDETNYNKLSFTLIRMLPLLSSNINTKSILIQFNIIPILERILHMKYDYKIQRYCLLTLRNLSDQIIHMDNFDSLIITFLQILPSTNDIQIKMYIIDILSNLSCENQSNKALMIRNNAIQILVTIIIQNDQRDNIIESTLCTLRHLTGKCPLAHEAREYIRINHAIPYLIKYLHTKENSWSLLKTCIGLIRNLALSSSNLIILCEHRSVYKIGKLFFQMKTTPERIELFITTLFVFCRQQNEKLQMSIYDQIIDSGCIETLVQFASSTNFGRIQQMSMEILDDLSQSDRIEHREMIRETDKSVKIAQFLQQS
ncbi:unnamed protein product [Rotaria socialis]|uniref:Armadillo repeat-containing protein 8 n=1 Tax=Rotaria socialis TaxID=392032 RepID=A0A818V6P3_9BILA|nr:unnamed protein product [Rotaria socialis]CAF4757348.1 unnamed protein product [Rotaria socialis]